jgi:hypothetical protein
MALLDSEIQRIRFELGYNLLEAGAEPYIGVVEMFSQVIQTYTNAGASTTCSTSVTAASTPTPVTLTLTSATGFAQFDRVIIDVDSRQEAATVQAKSGSTITVILSGAHSGTYPVTVEGGESIVRELLGQLIALSSASGIVSKLGSQAGIKKVDEVEFFGDDSKTSRLSSVKSVQKHLRQELADALGVVNLREYMRGGGSYVMEMY